MLSVEQQKDRGCAASTSAALALRLCLVQSLACVSAHAGGLPECSKAQLLGYVPADGELKAHRQFTVPAIDYPYGTKPASGWGLSLVLRIDESRRVVCFDHKDGFGNKEPLNDARSALIDKLGQWRYAPFERDGHPVAAIVTEEVSEQERPERHVPLPDVPIEKVSIALERTGCFGTCVWSGKSWSLAR